MSNFWTTVESVGLESPALVDTAGYLVKQVCCGAYHSALINREYLNGCIIKLTEKHRCGSVDDLG